MVKKWRKEKGLHVYKDKFEEYVNFNVIAKIVSEVYKIFMGLFI